MSTGRQVLMGFKRRWSAMQAIEIVLYALGPSVLAYFLTMNWLWTMAILVGTGCLGLLFRKPWQLDLAKIEYFLNHHLEATEYSTGLISKPSTELSGIAQLQQHKVSQVVQRHVPTLRPPVNLKRAVLVLVICILLSLLAFQYGFSIPKSTSPLSDVDRTITFVPLDSAQMKLAPPKIRSQNLTITYPAYTQVRPISTDEMSVKALEGSTLKWQLQFDGPVTKVVLEHNDGAHLMSQRGTLYEYQMELTASGFYNFRFEAPDSTSYQSKLFFIELTEDEAPTIEIQNLKQFTSFEFEEDKTLDFAALVTDDFGIADTYVVATVSRGEGEAVKFREERLSFEKGFQIGNKALELAKRIDLDALGMVPGDELYFYVAAVDTKMPKPGTTRSETYFAVIRDTITDTFGVEGTMGADLMPDYFRSQRQLIIDTEKLIADKKSLSKKDFNATSNALGFDQKALRLKYGEFMGDEAESGIAIAADTQEGENQNNAAQQEGEEVENALSAYTHDHDNDNEHHLVDHEEDGHEHHDHGAETGEEDPLESYLHNHDDPEESTLFTQSLKSKLRQAMTEMWDAELYLRLYTPEKSLPYQYRALKLIQEIKNSARIYVHRIGFDPPPIKEEKRLTGTLDEIVSFEKKEESTVPDDFSHLKMAAERLQELVEVNTYTESDRALFSKAGEELAGLAIEEPGRYLHTLQELKWLSNGRKPESPQSLRLVLSGVLAALPEPMTKPAVQKVFGSELNDLFLQELETDE